MRADLLCELFQYKNPGVGYYEYKCKTCDARRRLGKPDKNNKNIPVTLLSNQIEHEENCAENVPAEDKAKFIL